MKIYGVNIAEGSTITNLVVASGGTFPELASEGELFYRNDGANEGMYVFDGEEWVQFGASGAAPAGSLISPLSGDLSGTVEIGTTSTIYLAAAGTSGTYVTVTTDEKGRVISGTTTQAWSSITSTPTTLSGYGITDAQPLDADLTAIAALAGTSGVLRKYDTSSWFLDTTSYLINNQQITISGDASGTGGVAINLTLANTGVSTGTFTKVTVDSKGRVTTATTLSAADIPSLSATYQLLDADLTAIANLSGTAGILKKTAANTWVLDTASYATGNENITISGDASGAGTTSISVTLSNSGVAAGSYGSASAVPTVTFDSKGRATTASSTSISIAASQITSGTLSNERLTASNVTQFQSSLTIDETQITDGAWLARVGSSETISGVWSFNNPVTVATATSGSHAVTKDYVDNIATGLDMKASVRVATTANITLSGTQTIDGVAVIAGDRVLVKDQNTASQNGIYVVAAGAWARASDADNTPAGEVTAGMYTFVEEGTTNADSGWVLSTNNPITLDSTNLSFVQFNGLGQVTAGSGLTKTGNTMNVISASADRVVVNADSIDLATTGTAGTYSKVTTDAYGRVISGATLSAGDIPNLSSTYQPLDADLTAIAGLAGTSGLLKKTAADTWSLDTSAYLTSNQTITVSGDATGSGSTSISLTLANSGVVAGTFTKVTVDAKGRVTTATTLVAGDIPALSQYVLKAGDTMTGTLTGTNFYAGAGTTSSPSISFSADTNNGIYSPAADVIGFVTTGTEKMRIDSSGNIGIRNSSPQFKLDLGESGSSTSTDAIRLDVYNGPPAGGGTTLGTGLLWKPYFSGYTKRSAGIYQVAEGNYFRSGLAFYTNGTSDFSTDFAEVMRLSGAGNVGIGISSPTSKLHVSGTASFSSIKVDNGTGAAPSYAFNDDSTTGIYKPTTATLGFSTNGAQRMQITSAGHVGIGVTPTVSAGQMPVIQLNSAQYGSLGGPNGHFFITSNAYAATSADEGFATWNYINSSARAAKFDSREGNFRWFTTPTVGTAGNTITFTQIMSLNYDGNLGIGTTSPATFLTEFSAGSKGLAISNAVPTISLVDDEDTTNFKSWVAQTSGNMYLSNKSTTGTFIIQNAGAERMRIDANGRVLIGTATPVTQLPNGSLQLVSGAHIASDTFGRIFVPGQAIGSATYAGLYGLASTYLAYYNAGWKSLGGGTASAITIDEGIFSFCNSNSVAAAGSTLTWTTRMMVNASGNIGVGTSSYTSRLSVYGGDINLMANATYIRSATTAGTSVRMLGINQNDVAYVGPIDNGPTFTIYNAAATSVGATFYTSGTERMRIDSNGNVGIGTYSPTSLLTANLSTAATNTNGISVQIQRTTTGTAGAGLAGALQYTLQDAGGNLINVNSIRSQWINPAIGTRTANLIFTSAAGNAQTDTMILDSSGNLGLGVIPGTGTSNGFYLKNNANISFAGPVSYYDSNAAYSAGADRYVTTAAATRYQHINGEHRWLNAPSGTAGNAIGFTQAMTLDASGNLVVGSTSALTGGKISGISDLSTTNGFVYRDSASTYANNNNYILLQNSSSNTVGALTHPAVQSLGVWGWDDIRFLTGSAATERMRIDSSGNLGVGVTPSAWALTGSKVVSVGSTGATFVGQTSQPEIWQNAYHDGTSVRYVTTGAASRFSLGSDAVFRWFQTSSGSAGSATTFAQVMTLDTGGYLGIGTTSPTQRLHVVHNQNSTTACLIANSSTGTAAQAITQYTNGSHTHNFGILGTGYTTYGVLSASNAFIYSGGTNDISLAADGVAAIKFGTGAGVPERMRITSAGEVYIAGTTDQGAYNLQVNGTGVWGAGAYVNGSDARLKENVQTLNDGLSVVTQLRPVTFKYKSEYSRDQSIQPGFIAQELQQALAGKDYSEGIVQSGPEHLNVAYQSLIPLLTKAIQEQQAIIDNLTARIEALEGKK